MCEFAQCHNGPVTLPAMAPSDPEPVTDARPSGRVPVEFIVGLAACCLVALIALVIAVHGGPAPTIEGVALAVLPVLVVMAGVLYLDRLEPEPPTLLAMTFSAGAVAAGLIGLVGHGLGSALLTTPELGPKAGQLAATTLGAAFIGALVAETLKGLVLLGLLRYRRAELDGISDGIVYGAMTGLGFALVSNLFAYAQAERSGLSALVSAFFQRGLLTPLWDPLFSSMIGIGIAYAAMRPARQGRWAIAAGWAAAVVLHTVWDDSLRAGAARATIAYVILLGVLAMLLGAVVADRRRIVALIARSLPPYQASTTMTAEDLEMLASLRWRRIARQWARLHCGLGAARRMAEYQLAATELALACHRVEHGQMEQAAFNVSRDTALAIMSASATALRDRRPLLPVPSWAALGESAFAPPASERPKRVDRPLKRDPEDLDL
jgi:RsiW-degrading membrane proteinase PrsW (M82 family)